MKNILIILLVSWFLFPVNTIASTSSIPFTHKPLYGIWKKQVGSKPEDPLYVSFLRNYGIPDAQGTFFDSAKIAVLEPPKEHANYESLLDFMTPKEFTGDSKQLRMENDPLTFSETTLGGAKGRVIRGTGRLIYLDSLYPTTNMLAKGYFFETEKGVLEILVQIRSAKGDINKIEQDVDELVNSFRFGLPEDSAFIRLLKEIKPGKTPVEQPKNSNKLPVHFLFYAGAGIVVILCLLFLFARINTSKSELKTKKVSGKKKRKNKV